jgi:hypothetical protein
MHCNKRTNALPQANNARASGCFGKMLSGLGDVIDGVGVWCGFGWRAVSEYCRKVVLIPHCTNEAPRLTSYHGDFAGTVWFMHWLHHQCCES